MKQIREIFYALVLGLASNNLWAEAEWHLREGMAWGKKSYSIFLNEKEAALKFRIFLEQRESNIIFSHNEIADKSKIFTRLGYHSGDSLDNAEMINLIIYGMHKLAVVPQNIAQAFFELTQIPFADFRELTDEEASELVIPTTYADRISLFQRALQENNLVKAIRLAGNLPELLFEIAKYYHEKGPDFWQEADTFLSRVISSYDTNKRIEAYQLKMRMINFCLSQHRSNKSKMDADHLFAFQKELVFLLTEEEKNNVYLGLGNMQKYIEKIKKCMSQICSDYSYDEAEIMEALSPFAFARRISTNDIYPLIEKCRNRLRV